MSEKITHLGLKKFREKLGYRNNKMAKLLGVSSAVYSNWESGKRDPSFLVVQKLFEMGASVEELFGVQYSNITPPSLEGIKISREQAAEIVKAGMYAIMGNSGIVQNTNVLKED